MLEGLVYCLLKGGAMEYLDHEYLTRLFGDLIGEGQTVLGFARAYGKAPRSPAG